MEIEKDPLMSKIYFGLSKIKNLCPLNIVVRGDACLAALAIAIFPRFFSPFASTNNISTRGPSADRGQAVDMVRAMSAGQKGSCMGRALRAAP